MKNFLLIYSLLVGQAARAQNANPEQFARWYADGFAHLFSTAGARGLNGTAATAIRAALVQHLGIGESAGFKLLSVVQQVASEEERLSFAASRVVEGRQGAGTLSVQERRQLGVIASQRREIVVREGERLLRVLDPGSAEKVMMFLRRSSPILIGAPR